MNTMMLYFSSPDGNKATILLNGIDVYSGYALVVRGYHCKSFNEFFSKKVITLRSGETWYNSPSHGYNMHYLDEIVFNIHKDADWNPVYSVTIDDVEYNLIRKKYSWS